MLGTVLFFGRKNCKYSNQLKKNLDLKSKKFYYIESELIDNKLKRYKFLKKKFDHIFCFRSYFILSESLIKNTKYGAINFHPSTPKYRGVGGPNYALYNGDKFFGCTAHFMNKKIDDGKIIDVKKFKIKKNDNVESLLKKTYIEMFKQAMLLINEIEKNPLLEKSLIEKNKKYRWGKKINNMKSLNKFYEIKKNTKEKDLKKKLRATITKKHKPYLKLHNHFFFLKQ